MNKKIVAMVPGLVLVAVIAVIARTLASLLPLPISEVTIGVILGLIAGSLLPSIPVTLPGRKFAMASLLRIGIVLLGARLALDDVLQIGLGTILAILAGITLVLLITLAGGWAIGLPPKLCLLLGVGVSICGNSAILATAPVVDARERDVSFSVGTITFFGTLAVLIYPLIGGLFDISDQVFGYWTGLSVSDTAQVVAAGFAYSEPAGDLATVVKLVRNTLMGPLILLVGIAYSRLAIDRVDDRKASRSFIGSITRVVPAFVIGFILMAVLNTLGVFPEQVTRAFSQISQALILMALVAVGLNTNLRDVVKVGLPSLLLGLVAMISLSLLAITLTTAFLAS